MKFYNTASRSIEEFKPQDSMNVRVYTCGPTVYDTPHVGNWFTFIRYDLLIRALKANGFNTTWVMNITDVGHLVSDEDEGEDKLEKGARREGKTAWEVAKQYSEYFVSGMQRLNILEPDHLPKATDYIDEQIQFIQQLEVKGFTYATSDGVYFDTSKFSKYADFAHLDLDDQQEGARVEANPEKRQPSDFALWKFSPEGATRDMEWDSPWGKGFPGWHLECSAMILKLLGETIDIHAGGIDHISVHHTNEIAQSKAATGKDLARYWVHTNHITVNGEKISKSLGNGITLEDIEKRGISLEAFRLHVLESHYRTQSKFSWESLQAAENRLKNLYAMAALRWQPRAGLKDAVTFSYESVCVQLKEMVANDLNTPAALALLSDVETQVSSVLIENDVKDSFVMLLKTVDELLGLSLMSQIDISDAQKQLIHKRNTARENKDWTASDQVRDELKEQGIGLRDTDAGAIWYRL